LYDSRRIYTGVQENNVAFLVACVAPAFRQVVYKRGDIVAAAYYNAERQMKRRCKRCLYALLKRTGIVCV